MCSILKCVPPYVCTPCLVSAELLEQYQADNSLDMDSIAVEVQTDAVMVLSFLCEQHMHIKVMALRTMQALLCVSQDPSTAHSLSDVALDVLSFLSHIRTHVGAIW